MACHGAAATAKSGLERMNSNVGSSASTRGERGRKRLASCGVSEWSCREAAGGIPEYGP